jgi:membrane protein
MAAISAEREEAKAWWNWARLWHIAVATMRTFLDPDTSPRCAGTAFFGFLSFFPTIATVVFIFGLVADAKLLVGTVQSLTYMLPQTVLELVSQQLLNVSAQTPFALGIGLLISIPLALWSGSRGVDALLFAMSRVRGEPERRGFFMTVLYAVGLTIGGSIFLAVALLTVAGLPALIPFPTGEEVLVLILRWPVLLVVSVGVLAVLYRWGPDRHPRKFRYIWPGAILAATLWILAGAVFSIYVENWGNYELTFGSVSAAVVLLLWMYNSAQILVLGAAFNAEIERADTPENPSRPAKPRRAPARSQRKPSARKRQATA